MACYLLVVQKIMTSPPREQASLSPGGRFKNVLFVHLIFGGRLSDATISPS
jgi:hypothetical protein